MIDSKAGSHHYKQNTDGDFEVRYRIDVDEDGRDDTITTTRYDLLLEQLRHIQPEGETTELRGYHCTATTPAPEAVQEGGVSPAPQAPVTAPPIAPSP